MDFTGKSQQELLALRAVIEDQLEAIKSEGFNKAVEEYKAIAQALGVPVQEIAAAAAASQRKSAKPAATKSVPARYRDPSNPTNTWTGRGRKPKFVEEWLKAGKSITELEIRE